MMKKIISIEIFIKFGGACLDKDEEEIYQYMLL